MFAIICTNMAGEFHYWEVEIMRILSFIRRITPVSRGPKSGATQSAMFLRIRSSAYVLLSLCQFCIVSASTGQPRAQSDTLLAKPLFPHHPYDISQTAELDSSVVYASSRNEILALPSYLWAGLIYPLGELTIYAEHA